MGENALRRLLLGVAVLGALAGLTAAYAGVPALSPSLIWSAATVPVVIALSVAIVRDFLAGRVGVDAIALIAMAAALLMGQSLAAVVVAIMYAGGNVLEDLARGRAERNLKALVDRSPRTANVVRGDSVATVDVDAVAVGDDLLVRAGEIVPVDGELTGEWASLDESAVTGEPLPVRRVAGEMLRSGTINAADAFRMQARARADQSTYAAIVRMVAAAQTVKAPFIRMADRYALLMLPVTLAVAGLAWYLSQDALRALAVLVVATPCPLILAAPVAFIGGVSRAARQGILMKGSAPLEALAQARTAVFDKTGTLTNGGADLIDSDLAPGADHDTALRLLASLETASRHVLAEYIVAEARRLELPLSNPQEVREHRGAGLEGMVDGIAVRAGSRQLVLGDDPLPLWAERSGRRYQGQPVLRVFVSLGGRLAAIFVFGDAIRPDAPDVVRDLRAMGFERLLLLTGDDRATAARVAQMLGMDEFIADASPADKLACIAAQVRDGPTMMIGDGINDAPALATATVGVAVSPRGATAASQASDVIIIGNRIQPVADAVRIARRTRKIARQSIIVGLGLSGVAMVAAAFGLISPVAGAFLQEGIDVAVIVNALRALRDG